jgi:Uncharacterized protein conserved in bacteria (DUF2188)
VWLTEIEGAGPIYRHESEAAARKAGEEAARWLGTLHLIHGADGQVRRAVNCEDGRTW